MFLYFDGFEVLVEKCLLHFQLRESKEEMHNSEVIDNIRKEIESLRRRQVKWTLSNFLLLFGANTFRQPVDM